MCCFSWNSGISFVELLILHELWAGERLSLEKALPRYLRPGRPFSVSAVFFGPGRFLGALMRSLCLVPGGLARFVPCFLGANHCRLRHIGWGHALTSRPRESASEEPFLDELLFLFRYPVGSWRALLAGTLPLCYCFDRFACRTPTWRLPASGGVVDLVTANVADGRRVVPAAGRREIFGVRNSGLLSKRIRLNRKTHAHLAGFAVQSWLRVWKRLQPVDLFGGSFPGLKRRRCVLDHEGFIPAQARTGVGEFPGLCLPTSPGLRVLKLAVCSGACVR